MRQIKNSDLSCIIGGISTQEGPGTSPNVISVGAISQGGSIVSFSSRGPNAKGLKRPILPIPL